MRIPEINMVDYDYELPQSKIAQHAIEPRDEAKLLFYKNKTIEDSAFKNLPSLIPLGADLFYNDAKVIPARIFIKKESGTSIEIFLLKPFSSDYFTTLNSTSSCQWECLVGNKKKWKTGEILTIEISLENENIPVTITWQNREDNCIEMSWNTSHKFIDLLEKIGQMPLPPYIKREAELNDNNRYQTIYSVAQGSVAAPTAGLHFTEHIIQELNHKGFTMTPLTLHVSAGTFLPVSVKNAADHNMHREIFSINRILLERLKNSNYPIAVGTTSVRVLESLYWCAVNLKYKKENPFVIEKLTPYETSSEQLNNKEVFTLLLDYMDKQHQDHITGATSIMIMPGYEFKFINGLITNFHQPKSTLILLVAAFIGEAWQKVYNHALENNYRFLSYGDSSLLLK